MFELSLSWIVSALVLSIQTPAEAQSSNQPRLSLRAEIAAGSGETSVFDLLSEDREVRKNALIRAEEDWSPGLVPALLELLWQSSDTDPRARDIWRLLGKQTGHRAPRDVVKWFQWHWQQPDVVLSPDYPGFKADHYGVVDRRFRRWFYSGMKHDIRLDEILWGGVWVDGIPPLENPDFVRAAEADYLDGNHVVFGVVHNSEAKAYPKRILAWHELFNDRIGGEGVTCAYCTLCGAAVLYRQRIGSTEYDFGTSGFLYRSNKLMYDRQTHSLWSALEGRPVTGSLVGRGLKLEKLPIVTTTWEEWRRRHPETLVLSIETGHDRDYREGAAYRDYFSTQELMFPVPERDRRLKNKEEVLAMTLDGTAVAFKTAFLRKRRLHAYQVGERHIVILTDRSGASRVYESRGITFDGWDRQSRVTDGLGEVWHVDEDALTGPLGQRLPRLPAHRAFWFGWRAQFPDTLLVK